MRRSTTRTSCSWCVAAQRRECHLRGVCATVSACGAGEWTCNSSGGSSGGSSSRRLILVAHGIMPATSRLMSRLMSRTLPNLVRACSWWRLRRLAGRATHPPRGPCVCAPHIAPAMSSWKSHATTAWTSPPAWPEASGCTYGERLQEPRPP
eukprot:366230-Chlamydomonas_euryale.AAC.3